LEKGKLKTIKGNFEVKFLFQLLMIYRKAESFSTISKIFVLRTFSILSVSTIFAGYSQRTLFNFFHTFQSCDRKVLLQEVALLRSYYLSKNFSFCMKNKGGAMSALPSMMHY